MIRHLCPGKSLMLVDPTGRPQNRAVEEFLKEKGKEGQHVADDWARKIKRQLDAGYKSIRTGCGNDLTRAVEAVPENGVEYAVRCQQCEARVVVVRPSRSVLN